ncbi:MAG TPA: hypothetical protein D7I11_07435 [Candidatus Poseidoniales archaeon]|nr:MAG TPA: hypothetical protein D7I11_07435 [Candidatus Poseidoniales archaeon]HII28241.1 hypothetical protein [Poseidonia sp.]
MRPRIAPSTDEAHAPRRGLGKPRADRKTTRRIPSGGRPRRRGHLAVGRGTATPRAPERVHRPEGHPRRASNERTSPYAGPAKESERKQQGALHPTTSSRFHAPGLPPRLPERECSGNAGSQCGTGVSP